MLYIWTGAEAKAIRTVFEPALQMQPVKHQIIPFPFYDKKAKPPPLTIPSIGPGDVLLACGNRALEALMGVGIVPKKRTVGSCREKAMPYNQGHILVTYDPGMMNIDYARVPEMMWDCQLAIRLHENKTCDPVLGDYQWVDSFHELIQEIDRRHTFTGKPVYMAWDTETMGLDEYAPGVRIVSITFTIDSGKSFMMYFEEGEAPTQPLPWVGEDDMTYWEGVWNQINWLLTTEKVWSEAANGKYDSRWTNKKWAINCTNGRFDTMLVGSLLDENRSNSLKLHAKIMTPLGGYENGLDKYDIAHMEKVPKIVLGNYMGGDSDATHRSAAVMRKELIKDKKLVNFYTKILYPSSKVFEKMERTGIHVDAAYYDHLETEIEAEQARLQHEMKALVPKKLIAKYSDNFSFTRPVIIKDLFFSNAGYGLEPKMYTEKAKEQTSAYASTSIDHLMMFADEPEAAAFVKLLSELNSANKTQSTYVRGFRKHLRSDGRFHPSYMLFRGEYGNEEDDSGADTGRTSCKDPAAQTIPKHTKWTFKLRRAFTPPPGKTILQLDFSQGELKIAACLANELTMLNAYLNGMDLHSITAARISGYEYNDFMLLPDNIREELRYRGKAGNFGLLYGMGAEGFQNYAFSSYGVKMDLIDCEAAREAFFDLYPGLPKWHDYYKNLAHMHTCVRSPLGRLRHLPLIHSRDRQAASKAGRNAINSPVQSCLSDMMQYAMVLMDREYPELEMFLMTHDSIGIYVPVGEEKMWAKRLKAIMENLPLKKEFGWDHQLQFTADAEVSMPDYAPEDVTLLENYKGLNDGVTSLASLKKLKVLA